MQLRSAPPRRPTYLLPRLVMTALALAAPFLASATAGARSRRTSRRPPVTVESPSSDEARSEDDNAARRGGDTTEPVEASEIADASEESVPEPPKAVKRPGGPAVRASTEVSAYTDSDAVHVVSPTVAGSVADEVAGWSIGGSYLVDAVSAASVDIVSTASNHWTERRHVGAASANVRAGLAQISLAGGFSREPDYLSLGGGGVISVETFGKNVTPFLGGSYGHDLVGRTGDPMDMWQPLNKVGIKTGVTFVVNRSTIASLSFDGILERGYLAKPYRYLPVVAPGGAAAIPAGAPIDLVKSVNEYSVGENVPDERNRYAFAGRIAHRSGTATFRGDQRFYYDNWGMLASTTDVHEYLDLGSRVVIWPHVRAHAQRGVGFWRRITEQIPSPTGPPGIPLYRAGDRELGPLYTLTGGLGLKVRVNGDVRSPWWLTFQLDVIYTRYLDAIYISDRQAMFGALALESAF